MSDTHGVSSCLRQPPNASLIAAIATAPGGSISIVRMSGSGALDTLKSVFAGAKKLESHRVYYGHINHAGTADEVLCVVMLAPRSYTREDVVEINCHGGSVSANRVLRALLENGARLAEPGEFTKRAFLNGRIDLSQAEAVIDVINAKTELAQKMALSQLGGHAAGRVKDLRGGLLRLFAAVAASVDYPEETGPSSDNEILSGVNSLIAELDRCLKSAETGLVIKNGLSAAIIGRPNTGKSSLLNALLGRDRAIVSDIPGTTRDVVSEYCDIDGELLLRLSDTAGLRDSGDRIERLGVGRSVEEAENAALVIKVFDLSSAFDSEEDGHVLSLPCSKSLIVLNKRDLPAVMDMSRFDGLQTFRVSAKSGEGMDELKAGLKGLVFGQDSGASAFFCGERAFSNERHKSALIAARNSLGRAKETLEGGLGADLASIDMEDAYKELGAITGETANEDIIDRIFADFCLGK